MGEVGNKLKPLETIKFHSGLNYGPTQESTSKVDLAVEGLEPPTQRI